MSHFTTFKASGPGAKLALVALGAVAGVLGVGTASKPDEMPKVLPMISVSPRRSLTVPTTEAVVRGLGLKKGVRLVALDLSGL